MLARSDKCLLPCDQVLECRLTGGSHLNCELSPCSSSRYIFLFKILLYCMSHTRLMWSGHRMMRSAAWVRFLGYVGLHLPRTQTPRRIPRTTRRTTRKKDKPTTTNSRHKPSSKMRQPTTHNPEREMSEHFQWCGGWDSNPPHLFCLAARTQDDCHLAYSSRRSSELTAIFFACLTQNV